MTSAGPDGWLSLWQDFAVPRLLTLCFPLTWPMPHARALGNAIMDKTGMSMTTVTRIAAFGLGLALAGAWMLTPVLAQTTTEAPVVEGAPATNEGLSMGTEVGATATPPTQETAEPGQTYLLTNFEQWEQRCVKAEDGSDPCQLYQLLKDKDGNSVAEFSPRAARRRPVPR